MSNKSIHLQKVSAAFFRDRFFLLTLSVFCMLAGCKKTTGNGGGSGGQDDYTPVPAYTPVTTSVTASLDDGYQPLDVNSPPLFTFNLTNTVNSFFTTDLYNTHGLLQMWAPAIYYDAYKVVQLTPSIRNYVGFNIYNKGWPTGPSLDPVYYRFAGQIPSSIYDSAGKRWFLKSWGGIFSQISRLSDSSSAPLLEIPIDSTLMRNAPDTVSSWYFNETTFVWQRNGIAVKNGGFYEIRAYVPGLWNVATPVNGVYLYVRLRTDSASTLTNTLAVLSGDGISVAEGRTDADGNMLCFVPAGVPLSIGLYPIQFAPQCMYSTSLGAFNKASTANVMVKISSVPALTTINGSIYNCDGAPLNSGFATIVDGYSGQPFYAPVKDGYFSTSIWVSGATIVETVQITDSSNNQSGDVTNLDLNYAAIYNIDLSSCPNSTLLYCNYSLDGVNYSLKDEASSPSTFMKAIEPETDLTGIRTDNGKGLGVNFTGNLDELGIHHQIVTDIEVNGVSYQSDLTGNSEIGYSRYDTNEGGYIEGNFAIFPTDGNGKSHQIYGSFKVKKDF